MLIDLTCSICGQATLGTFVNDFGMVEVRFDKEIVMRKRKHTMLKVPLVGASPSGDQPRPADKHTMYAYSLHTNGKKKEHHIF